MLEGETIEQYKKRLIREKNARFRQRHAKEQHDAWQAKYWANGGDNAFRRRQHAYSKEKWDAMTPEEHERVKRVMRGRSKRYSSRRRADRRLAANPRSNSFNTMSDMMPDQDDLAWTLEDFKRERGVV